MATAFTPDQLVVLASICDAAYQGYEVDSPVGKEILRTIDFESQTEERKEQSECSVQA